MHLGKKQAEEVSGLAVFLGTLWVARLLKRFFCALSCAPCASALKEAFTLAANEMGDEGQLSSS
eukprot:5034681-Amphidinium_carterae.1